MNTLWVYKCNRSAESQGDWDEFFDCIVCGIWGGTWATTNSSSLKIIREEMQVGDLVLAWQSDKRLAIGLCRVKDLTEDGEKTHIVLDTIERFTIPVNLLKFKKGNRALMSGKAFRQGQMGTIFETTPDEAKEILRICGVKTLVIQPRKRR